LLNPDHSAKAATGPSIQTLIQKGESDRLEFKSTLRWNIKAQRHDKEIERSVLKTIAAFLNSEGGTLLIGVDDQGKLLGLEEDGFKSIDALLLHMTNLIKDRIGAHHNRFIRLSVEELDEKQVLRVECKRGIIPAYYKDDRNEIFYFRAGPSTLELPTSEVHDYIKHRFHQ
jgi:predicted HTH transcriptional regulator